MNDELARLAAQRAADPANEEVARRHEQALLRAGKRDELRALYRTKFQCQQKWPQFERTQDPFVRFCTRCSREVTLVGDADSLRKNVQAERSVAVWAGRYEKALDVLIEDPQVHSAQDDDSPCLIGLRLAEHEIARSVLDTVPYAIARRYGFIPLRLVPEGLVIACAAPPPDQLAGVLKDLGVTLVRHALVPKAELEEFLTTHAWERRRMKTGHIEPY